MMLARETRNVAASQRLDAYLVLLHATEHTASLSA